MTGAQSGEREAGKVVNGQTTEARGWDQPKGSGLHSWSWGVTGEVICRSDIRELC